MHFAFSVHGSRVLPVSEPKLAPNQRIAKYMCSRRRPSEQHSPCVIDGKFRLLLAKAAPGGILYKIPAIGEDAR
jgi:hypothetical protein